MSNPTPLQLNPFHLSKIWGQVQLGSQAWSHVASVDHLVAEAHVAAGYGWQVWGNLSSGWRADRVDCRVLDEVGKDPIVDRAST